MAPHTFTEKIATEKYAAATLPADNQLTVGQLILSPTRTYAPLLKNMLEHHFDKIHGLVHCSGGGQTKCMKYLPGDFKIVKDNMLAVPPVFDIIKQSSRSDNREMYQVFNMGCRLEVFTTEKAAADLIAIGQQFGIDAQITGRVEASTKKELLLKLGDEEIVY